jgi:hypothetical protein
MTANEEESVSGLQLALDDTPQEQSICHYNIDWLIDKYVDSV